MTSSGSGASSWSSAAGSAPVPIVDFALVLWGPEGLLVLIDLSLISSHKTHAGMDRHWDPMSMRLSVSSLLDLLMCHTSHPSKVPSRL
jgi:hypothetical protein